MELLDKSALEVLRMKKLKKQLSYVYKNSEFYRQKFEEAGAKPGDIKDFETFRKLPIFLNKDEHRKNQELSIEKYGHALGTFICVPIEALRLISSTSGTTGMPTYYLFTKKDLDIQAELAARQQARAGIQKGDVLLQASGMSGLYLGGAPVTYYNAHHGPATLVPLGAEVGAQKLFDTILATKTTVLLATPSYMTYLIEAAPKLIKRDVAELGIRLLFAIGEPGAGIPEVRTMLAERYRAKVFDFIGPGTNFAAVSCDHPTYQGMHSVSLDYAIDEDVVDPITKEPLKIENGVIGEQIRTALEREAGPFIRYSVGDLIQVFTDPCPCGLPGHRIKVIGRADDMIIVKGVNVFPGGISSVISSFVPKLTGHFRIVLTEPPPRVVPPLKIKVELGYDCNGQADTIKKELSMAFHNLLKIRPEIEFLPPETLPRAAKKTDWFERLYKL